MERQTILEELKGILQLIKPSLDLSTVNEDTRLISDIGLDSLAPLPSRASFPRDKRRLYQRADGNAATKDESTDERVSEEDDKLGLLCRDLFFGAGMPGHRKSPPRGGLCFQNQ